MSRPVARVGLRAASLAGAVALTIGCMPPPDIKSMYLGGGTPVPRPDSAEVEVFLRSDPPSRPHVTIGEVEIATQREKRSMEEMLGYARDEARRMGGEALIVETGSAPGDTRTTPVKNLYTGETMYYQSDTRTRRSVRGTVIVWKAQE
jgi:hypothetical protein